MRNLATVLMNNKTAIKTHLAGYGTKIVGFGNIPETVVVPEIEERFPRVIVFGFPLSKSVLETIKDRPTLIYKHHYKTVNWILDQTAYHVVQYIEKLGAHALAIPASQTVDWEHQTGHISHKLLAQEAGLGFIGKSGLLIHPDHGAQVRYASVLTDLEFEPDEICEGTCGECRRCLDACPCNAITDDGVNLSRCLAQLKEFSRIRGIGQFICGICVKVCDGSN
jgi:epoxyqueuosine reductase